MFRKRGEKKEKTREVERDLSRLSVSNWYSHENPDDTELKLEDGSVLINFGSSSEAEIKLAMARNARSGNAAARLAYLEEKEARLNKLLDDISKAGRSLGGK